MLTTLMDWFLDCVVFVVFGTLTVLCISVGLAALFACLILLAALAPCAVVLAGAIWGATTLIAEA